MRALVEATDIPTSLDDLVRESRAILADLRKQYPDPEDFDHQVKLVITDALLKYGFTGPTLAFTLRAIFAKD